MSCLTVSVFPCFLSEQHSQLWPEEAASHIDVQVACQHDIPLDIYATTGFSPAASVHSRKPHYSTAGWVSYVPGEYRTIFTVLGRGRSVALIGRPVSHMEMIGCLFIRIIILVIHTAKVLNCLQLTFSKWISVSCRD